MGTQESVVTEAMEELRNLHGQEHFIKVNGLETDAPESDHTMSSHSEVNNVPTRRLVAHAAPCSPALEAPEAVGMMSPLSVTLLGAGAILGGFIAARFCLRKRRRSRRPILPRYDNEEVDLYIHRMS